MAFKTVFSREAWLLHDREPHPAPQDHNPASQLCPGSTFCSKPLYPARELPGKPWEWDFKSGCCGDLPASRCGAKGQMTPQSRAGNGASPYKGMYSMQGTHRQRPAASTVAAWNSLAGQPCMREGS